MYRYADPYVELSQNIKSSYPTNIAMLCHVAVQQPSPEPRLWLLCPAYQGVAHAGHMDRKGCYFVGKKEIFRLKPPSSTQKNLEF